MKKPHSVGIRELAAHLGMAISTVSRAMNDRGEVSPETRKRILAEAERLGYRPNQSGRSLRSGSTKAVALTMRTDIGRSMSGETFFMALSEGLQSTLANVGYDLMILPCASDQDENEFLYRAVDRRLADGFIISNVQRIEPRIDYLRKWRMPFIALGSSETKGDYAALDLDFAGVAETSVHRLAAQGHKRILLGLTAQETNNNYVFLAGFKAGLEKAGLAFNEGLVVRLHDRISGGYELASTLLAMDDRPTAALLIQETMAMGLYQRLGEAGLQPGKDLAVIGFRENPVCRYLTPSLTCFRIDLKRYGARLGEMIIAELDAEAKGADRTDFVHEVWPMELVPGKSDTSA
ncbi:LacI family DNA-binding transcriptional regulator [Rhizobium calliandrae]|uniref:LacI family DNA-binding transcriptional regulator n=1 Tax=Rhizobium calliandrae TaxID=1312182 RepID=A0ABT7KS35_9HYPH|nr:LacI family DNA-binding transcriptional regulator [Rhizobium calliandrae]MDL2410239.1 LacI family DNA-binding transcriptional regulator [Rhizobium calliandrae]